MTKLSMRYPQKHLINSHYSGRKITTYLQFYTGVNYDL